MLWLYRSFKIPVRTRNGEFTRKRAKGIMVVDTKKLLNLFEMFLLVPHLKEKILSVPHMMNHMSIHLSVSMVCKAFE